NLRSQYQPLSDRIAYESRPGAGSRCNRSYKLSKTKGGFGISGAGVRDSSVKLTVRKERMESFAKSPEYSKGKLFSLIAGKRTSLVGFFPVRTMVKIRVVSVDLKSRQERK